MATITITFDDALQSRIVNGIATSCNYAGRKLANETKGQFAKRMVIEWAKERVKEAEIRTAVTTAEDTAKSAVENEIIIS